MNLAQKKLIKTVIGNLILLFLIIISVVILTGIPMNFDIFYEKGSYRPNMPWSTIADSIKNNFKMVFTGEIRNVDILGETVAEIFQRAIKKSGIVLFFGIILSVILGIPKGILDSRKTEQTGTFKMLQSLIPLSIPDVLSIGLVQVLALFLFKNGMTFLGIGPIEFKGDQYWYNAIYPILAISILPTAYVARTTATAIEEGFSKPYVLAARGKGCSKMRIIKNHLLKSIFYQVLSVFPTVLALFFSSLIIVERLFYYRGIGYEMINFYTSQRIDPVMGGIAFSYFMTVMAVGYFVILFVFNLCKDLLIPTKKD
jgi:oligopeptide transport system permease protein